MATSRFKDRYRDFKKVFKENWALFNQSKLGKIGLYIIIFFVIIALAAPLIPYANDRDPVLWMAPDKDLIEIQHMWGSPENNYIITVAAGTDENGNVINYPVMARPVGMLSDGSSLNELNDLGSKEGNGQWLEAIYLSTGDVGKGVVDINPLDGSQNLPSITMLPPGHYSRISSAIPAGMGPVNSSVTIYELRPDDGGTDGHSGNIYITTTTGNIIAIRAVVHFDTSGSNTRLFPIEYSLLWTYNINDSISQSADLFYGNLFDTSDDMVVVSSDHGYVYAFYPNNGTVRWSNKLDGSGFFTPISIHASNMTVVTSSSGTVYALDMHNGTEMWNATFDEEFTSTIVADVSRKYYDNNALLFAGTMDGSIYGIRLYGQTSNSTENSTAVLKKAGEVQQIIRLPGAQGSPVGGIYITAAGNPQIFVGTTIYTNGQPSGMGAMYCIDVDKVGTENEPLKWYYPNTIGGISSRPAYFDNRYVYFSLDSGSIYAVKIADGNITWRATVKEDAHIVTPLIATQIPGGDAQAKYVTVAADTGEMTQLSTDGKYLAPLPPTWVQTAPSGNTYLLGTDAFGRDIFSQLIWGSRIALLVGFAASFFSVMIGIIVGVVAGYFGGWVDSVLMRFTDVILVMPFLPLIIVFAAVMGPSIWNIIIAITLVGWPGTARIIRSQVLSLKERPFIDAARVTGASNVRIMFKHIIPNVLPLAFLYMTFAVTGAILGEASLSFIGLGDPTTMSWGMMLYNISHGSGYTLTAWWWLLPPGLAITFLVLGFFLVGRAFEEIINPRLRRRR